MKVLHVITGLGMGGAEHQLRMLLRRSRHEAEVLSMYNRGAVADMIEESGGRVTDLGMRSNTQLGVLPRMVRHIRVGRYDVVHVHLYRACVYGRPAARLAGVPVVVTTEHSIGETHIERRRMSPGVRALYLATDLFSDATIAVSEAVRDRLVRWGVPARKIETIPNGLDFSPLSFDPVERARVRRELAIEPDDYVVGVLGRLDPNKRFDLVISSLAPLLGPGRRLLVVGDGTERDRLDALARGLGLDDRVVFAGERHDVPAVLAAMDLFIGSSAQETFGLNVLEALASGMPALFTTCPALDGIDTGGRARQVAGESEAIRVEVAREMSVGRRPRVPVPAIEEQYGIAGVAGRIDGLYERLAVGGRADHQPVWAHPRAVVAD